MMKAIELYRTVWPQRFARLSAVGPSPAGTERAAIQPITLPRNADRGSISADRIGLRVVFDANVGTSPYSEIFGGGSWWRMPSHAADATCSSPLEGSYVP